jgi:transmembrane sensor
LSKPASDPGHAVLQQAALWFARLGAAPNDADLAQAFSHWLDASPSHRAAWARVERIRQHVAGVHPLAHPASEALQQARSEVSRRRALQMLGLASLGLATAVCTGQRQRVFGQLQAWRADQRTRVGEVRHLTLAEGTQVWLNAGTALDIRLGARSRELSLWEGEVLIQTAPDRRPFMLHTRQGRLTPLGTRFSVTVSEGLTQLDVYEGAVRAEIPQADRTVPAGHHLAFDALSWQSSGPARAARQSWSAGTLLADEEPLGAFIEELSRYRHGYLGVAPEVAGLRVVGAFPLHDPDQALAMLESALPVRVVRTLPWWVEITAR